MKRRALAAVAGVAAFVAVYAGAAAFDLPSYDLGAGNSTVAACDTAFTVDGFAYDGGGLITAVTIGGIDAACVGGALTVQLTDSLEASVGVGGPVTVSGTSAYVPVSGLPNPNVVKHEVIVIVGP